MLVIQHCPPLINVDIPILENSQIKFQKLKSTINLLEYAASANIRLSC